ncbi:glucosyl-3-phosphoglycerate synthase [Streptomyces diacarni]|uniref:Glucosyl-3-phosphoglycerate synthase n=1 Tax=Streptomyces diacarni TaxID=2800381 RepID=A0A367FGZ9_9ACTN|nr:glucosyl-3-phosphoglycerate synthase [Streptomyces diacarni]RCG28880.1 glucosyl-3-phosphoglycerate synthase [Streptomyces diacarni]
MLDEVGQWLRRRSWRAADRPLEALLAAKRRTGTTVSVVLPALNEEATVGDIVSIIRRELASPHPATGTSLVDEVIVMNSGSTDATGAVAAAAGARVVHRDEVLPRVAARPGKGEVLWRSLMVTRGDIVCFVDADLREFSPDFVTGIVGPLLTEPDVQLVKAMYDRPLRDSPAGGGRVTELVARPLLNLHWPRLAGLVQPLGGEYAARRSLLERLPFPVGYGVELGLLVDALELVGLDALAQVDVGVRLHRNQDGLALGRMATAIYATAQRRIERGVGLDGGPGGHRDGPSVLGGRSGVTPLTQFERGEGGTFEPRGHLVDAEERPPMCTVPEYGQRRVAA